MCPWAIRDWAMNNDSSIGMEDLMLLLGVGIATFLAQKFLTIALKYANPATLAPISYTGILYSGLLGWIFWDEMPEALTLAGMILVVCGCVLTVFMNRPSAAAQPTA